MHLPRRIEYVFPIFKKYTQSVVIFSEHSQNLHVLYGDIIRKLNRAICRARKINPSAGSICFSTNLCMTFNEHRYLLLHLTEFDIIVRVDVSTNDMLSSVGL